MSVTARKKSFFLLVAATLLAMGIALFPSIATSIVIDDDQHGQWLVTGRSTTRQVNCSSLRTCVEWCAQGGTAPTGELCCMENDRLPSDKRSDCTQPIWPN